MTTFKRVKFIANNKAGAVDTFTTRIEITADGIFYARIPRRLRVAFSDDDVNNLRRHRSIGEYFTVSAATFNELKGMIEKAHREAITPTVKKEPVILFNIESHVSFATNKDGKIFPNAGFPGASWHVTTDDKTYGEHHACNPSAGGYSLTIGAKAMLKKTATYGDKSQVEYDYYYKDGDHRGRENPAELLNSWCSMLLPEDAREMPYSDEAAMFFFNLIQGMAELNRRIQEFTNTQKKLIETIQRNSNVLMLTGPEAKPKGTARGEKGSEAEG